MVFVVALSAVFTNQVVFDGTLQAAWHVGVHHTETIGHAERLVADVARTALLLHLGMTKVDARGNILVLWHIAEQDSTEAVLAERAAIRITHGVAPGFLREELFCL